MNLFKALLVCVVTLAAIGPAQANVNVRIRAMQPGISEPVCVRAIIKRSDGGYVSGEWGSSEVGTIAHPNPPAREPVEAAGPVDALMRVVLTRGGRRVLTIEPMPPRLEVARVATVTYAPTRVLDGLKTLSYAGNMLAGRLARERGFDEALLVTPHGRVLEGPTWSFFWVAGGRLLTPPLEDHILDSITRRYVLEECDGEERPCTLDDVGAAEEAFIASTVREVMPIAAVDDIALPAAPGPVSVEAAERLARRIESELVTA
jgi:branched-chain amino acid aminotransferase